MASVAEYIAGAPPDKRAELRRLRAAIRATAPDASEALAYGLVGYKYKGRPLVYFGYAKQHCALYGGWVQDFADELKEYVASKGTLRSTPAKPLPTRLVRRIVRARKAAIDAGRR